MHLKFTSDRNCSNPSFVAVSLSGGTMLCPPWHRNRNVHQTEKQDQGSAASSPHHGQGGLVSRWTCLLKERSHWRQVYTSDSRQTLSLPSLVPFYNRYKALGVEGQTIDDVDDGPSAPEVLLRSERFTPCNTNTSMRKKRQVIVVILFWGE